MKIRAITSTDTLPLRQALLRPHLSVLECVYPGDDDLSTCHLGAFNNEALIGLVSVYQNDLPDHQTQRGYQFRALAIVEAMRGKGFGFTLLHAVEQHARENSADYLWANARITAVNFYRKAGYSIDEKEFVVEGVGPHVIVSRTFPR